MAAKLAVSSLLVGSAAAFSVSGAALQHASLRRAAPTMEASSPLAPNIVEMSPPVLVQGQTLKTWDLGDESTERVQLTLKSSGRPIDTRVELWHTPSYIPTTMRIYTEDGTKRPVNMIIETPKHPKTVAVYNTGSMEFPFSAHCANTGLAKAAVSLADVEPEKVQGGQVTSHTFGAETESVQILLSTAAQGERNMKAKIELTQGPNQVKQFIEVYASSGYKNPLYAVIQTPGSMSTIRVINQNNVEFPFDAWVLPYETSSASDMEPVLGGGF